MEQTSSTYRYETIMRQTKLSAAQATQLRALANAQHVSEDELIARALDLFFTVSELFDERSERRAWHRASEAALDRLWDNDQDAAYDNWRTLYDVPAG